MREKSLQAEIFRLLVSSMAEVPELLHSYNANNGFFLFGKCSTPIKR